MAVQIPVEQQQKIVQQELASRARNEKIKAEFSKMWSRMTYNKDWKATLANISVLMIAVAMGGKASQDWGIAAVVGGLVVLQMLSCMITKHCGGIAIVWNGIIGYLLIGTFYEELYLQFVGLIVLAISVNAYYGLSTSWMTTIGYFLAVAIGIGFGFLVRAVKNKKNDDES